MRTREKIVVAAIVVPLAVITAFAVGVLYYITRPPRTLPGIPRAVLDKKFRDETTFATASDVQTKIGPVPLAEIVSQTTGLAAVELRTEEGRRAICVRLFRDAGFDPTVTEAGDVLAFKDGLTADYVAIGAHYDKVDGPSLGVLDNMLGCILVAKTAKALRNHETDFGCLFVAYGNEEVGKKIGWAFGEYRRRLGRRPVYTIEVDYVGDRRGELGGRWISPMAGGALKTGLKITTCPMPDPPTIHTERDCMDNVDFTRAFLAYKTVISLVEGIEQGKGLSPPDTVNFWKKDCPLVR